MPELALECIGDDISQAARGWEQIEKDLGVTGGGKLWPSPWCADVIGERANGTFDLRFLRGRKDYTHANSVGSRGVYLWFSLVEDRVYWVQARESWSRIRRYYCTAHEGRIIEITEEDARACLSDRSE